MDKMRCGICGKRFPADKSCPKCGKAKQAKTSGGRILYKYCTVKKIDGRWMVTFGRDMTILEAKAEARRRNKQ